MKRLSIVAGLLGMAHLSFALWAPWIARWQTTDVLERYNSLESLDVAMDVFHELMRGAFVVAAVIGTAMLLAACLLHRSHPAGWRVWSASLAIGLAAALQVLLQNGPGGANLLRIVFLFIAGFMTYRIKPTAGLGGAIFEPELPEGALLQPYRRDGSYTDCYCMEMPRAITMAQYVSAFYTTALFKVERRILAVAVRKPSTDQDAQALALGHTSDFAAWRVEGRTGHQLLLCDFLGRTRSWLMVEPMGDDPAGPTRLYFGSAVVPKSRSAQGRASFGWAFHALGGFHRLYSKALMRAAHAKLSKGPRPPRV